MMEKSTDSVRYGTEGMVTNSTETNQQVENEPMPFGIEQAMQLAAQAALDGVSPCELYNRKSFSVSFKNLQEDEAASAHDLSAFASSSTGQGAADLPYRGAHAARPSDVPSEIRVSAGAVEYEEVGPPAIIKDADGQEYLVQPVRESIDRGHGCAPYVSRRQLGTQSYHPSEFFSTASKNSSGDMDKMSPFLARSDSSDAEQRLYTPFGEQPPGGQFHPSLASRMMAQPNLVRNSMTPQRTSMEDLMRRVSLDGRAGSADARGRNELDGNQYVDVGQLYLRGLLSNPRTSVPIELEKRLALMSKYGNSENNLSQPYGVRLSHQFSDRSGADTSTTGNLGTENMVNSFANGQYFNHYSPSQATESVGKYGAGEDASDLRTISSKGGISLASDGSDDDNSWEIDISELKFGPRIGVGAYGEVYRGLWRETDVAIKMLFEHDVREKTVNNFKKEVSIIKKLRHPNILQFMGACTVPPNLCIVSEFVTKGSLFKLLHRTESFNPSMELKLRMALDVARGVHYLHTCKPPIIHGDLKSPNLLLDRNYVVKVCDFGLSRVKIAAKLSVVSDMGTPEWTAPEVLQSNPSSEASDVYSFGVVLWELMTMKVPWADKNPMQVVLTVGFHKERLEIPNDAPDRIKRIIDKCFSAPEERPTFSEILSALKLELREQMIS